MYLFGNFDQHHKEVKMLSHAFRTKSRNLEWYAQTLSRLGKMSYVYWYLKYLKKWNFSVDIWYISVDISNSKVEILINFCRNVEHWSWNFTDIRWDLGHCSLIHLRKSKTFRSKRSKFYSIFQTFWSSFQGIQSKCVIISFGSNLTRRLRGVVKKQYVLLCLSKAVHSRTLPRRWGAPISTQINFKTSLVPYVSLY